MSPTPATISRQARIIDAVATRLRVITRGNGFTSDVGDQLFVGFAPALGPDDPEEALALTIGETEPRVAGSAHLIDLQIQVHALAKYTAEDAWMRVEQIVADIRAAMELDDDRRLDGLLSGAFERGQQRPYEATEGSEAIGLTLTYIFPFKDAWGGVV